MGGRNSIKAMPTSFIVIVVFMDELSYLYAYNQGHKLHEQGRKHHEKSESVRHLTLR